MSNFATATGTPGDDTLLGGSGDDTLRGEGGDDVLQGGAGDDLLDGGSGNDTASWADADGPVIVDLVAGTAETEIPSVGDSFRLMPLGDSITHGYITRTDIDGGGYRLPLWDLLEASGIDVNFVGSQDDGPSGFDDDHQGHAGKTIDWLEERVEGFLDENPADAILLMAGTNDTRESGETASDMASDLARLLATTAAAAPSATIFVATLLPMDPDEYSDRAALIQGFNALIPGVVEDAQDDGLSVVLVDMSQFTESDLADGIHPDGDTYAEMASLWFEALEDAGFLDGAGGVETDTLVDIENITGSDFDDVLSGDANDNRIDGGQGEDRMRGRGGNDIYLVDDRDDEVIEEADGGRDTVLASVDYTLAAHVEQLILEGGADLDGTGNGMANQILGNAGDNTIDGREGDDLLSGGAGEDRVEGGDGDDTISGDADDDVLFGEDGADVIRGGAGADDLDGGAGDDQLFGDEGSDDIKGGSGDDTLDGGGATDVLHGEAGDDTLLGGDGDDNLDGGADDDALNGGSGDDTLQGGSGADILRGGGGADMLFGGADADQLSGGGGADILNGGGGDDALSGQAGADTLNGGARSDMLSGGRGADTLSGGGGRDLLNGGRGDDVLSGDGGRDTFEFVWSRSGRDTVLDFDLARDHLFLDLRGRALDAVTASVTDRGTVLTLGQSQIEFLGVEADLSDFSLILA